MDDLFNARIQEAIKACNHADVILFVGGISPNLEGEEMNVKVPGFSGGDRTDIEFPATQQVLMEALVATGKPVILIITNGSAMAINWADQHVSAILEAWYPGEEGGNAVADILFGKYNPAGRLPVTFYRSVNDLPAFDNYSMEGRTYRYFRNKPLYEFGFGLSYTTFVYGQPVVMKSVMREDENLEFSVTVSNTGKMDGDEVIQVYLTRPEGNSSRPVKSLIAFKRVSIPAGKSATTVFTIPASRFRHYDPGEDDYTVTRGDYTVMIGSSSRDIRQKFSVLIK
jgi:beta-glucosidase